MKSANVFMNYYFQKCLSYTICLIKQIKSGIQQEALAYSVYAAGENIDHLEAIDPVIKRITEKHRAIGIKPEQYPIVGATLLNAVKDVLGDAATEEVLGAWKKLTMKSQKLLSI